MYLYKSFKNRRSIYCLPFYNIFFLGATKRLYTAGMRIQQKNRNEEKNLFIFWLGKFKIRSYKPSF